MPLLRGHHLICLHFFNGEGYNEAFVENLRSIMVLDGEIEICSGADDICKCCPYLKDGTCQYSQDAEEEIEEMDKKALDLLGLAENIKVKWDVIKEKISAIFPRWYESFCMDCDWKHVCEKNEFFRKVKSKAFKSLDDTNVLQ